MFSVFKEELVHSSLFATEPILRSFQQLKNVCPEPKAHNLSIFGSVTAGHYIVLMGVQILQYEITCEITWSRIKWKQIFAQKFDLAKSLQFQFWQCSVTALFHYIVLIGSTFFRMHQFWTQSRSDVKNVEKKVPAKKLILEIGDI